MCAPGMGADLAVKVRCRRGSTSLPAKGEGVHREMESGGGPGERPRPDEQEPHPKPSR
ncbi:MAG: hypothetical protein K6U74_08870 [Firmicutes bacterium]|nr:hypothetical protein [Bacillota bacterium]